MIIDTADLISSYVICPGQQEYIVVWFGGEHKTLTIGDRVHMVESPSPNLRNCFYCFSDKTLHGLQTKNDDYVLVVPVQKEESS